MYRDERLVCENCGKAFVYRIEEQRAQEALGFDAQHPEYCPDCREKAVATPGLHPGVIKWYREDKRFGFIVQRDGSEIFFHRSGVQGDSDHILLENTPVWYEVTMTDRGPQAINIHDRE